MKGCILDSTEQNVKADNTSVASHEDAESSGCVNTHTTEYYNNDSAGGRKTRIDTAECTTIEMTDSTVGLTREKDSSHWSANE